MPGVLGAVLERELVQVLQFALADADVGVGLAEGIERFEVTGHLLLVAVLQLRYVELGKQGVHGGIVQAAALDAGGSAHALDGGDGLEVLERTAFAAFDAGPLPGEAVHPADGLEQVPGEVEAEGVDGGHIRKYTLISVLYPQMTK